MIMLEVGSWLWQQKGKVNQSFLNATKWFLQAKKDGGEEDECAICLSNFKHHESVKKFHALIYSTSTVPRN